MSSASVMEDFNLEERTKTIGFYWKARLPVVFG